MGEYEVWFKKSVSKDLRHIPKADLKRILGRIYGLRKEPRPSDCKKLSGQERYRIRQGDYRIIYEIEDCVLLVMVVKVGNRRDVYE